MLSNELSPHFIVHITWDCWCWCEGFYTNATLIRMFTTVLLPILAIDRVFEIVLSFCFALNLQRIMKLGYAFIFCNWDFHCHAFGSIVSSFNSMPSQYCLRFVIHCAFMLFRIVPWYRPVNRTFHDHRNLGLVRLKRSLN